MPSTVVAESEVFAQRAPIHSEDGGDLGETEAEDGQPQECEPQGSVARGHHAHAVRRPVSARLSPPVS